MKNKYNRYMSDKLIKDGQMAGDPELEGEKEEDPKSYMIPESDDEFLVRKAKWKWKPSRLIFLWLFLQIFQVTYMFATIWVTSKYFLMINIDEKQIGGIIILLITFKSWWYKNK